MNDNKHLTATDFYQFFQCPHWPYWERFGDPTLRRQLSESEERRMNDGLVHEKDIVKKMYGELVNIEESQTQPTAEQTLALMKAGSPVIYQGVIEMGDWLGKPDILERRPGKSRLGDWYYVPVDVKSAHELKKEHKAQLTFYSVILESIQGILPPDPAVINADGDRIPFRTSSFLSEFNELAEQLERIRDREMPDPVFRKACLDTSPWGAACEYLAKSSNDIALLYNVDVKKLKALRSLNIRTVNDAAEMDPFALEGQFPGLTLRALEAIKRQANAVLNESVFIRAPFIDVTQGLEIHFDIESHPPTDTDYLYGFWIPSEQRYLSFTAETTEKERDMWFAFLAWIETLPSEYTIYHYAPYERQRLKLLSRRYQTEENVWLQKFTDNMVDLKDIVADHLVFPLPFYSLKSIGKFLGFTWEGDVHSGGESVTAFDKWLETKERSILEAIIQYNREDVRATAFLLTWIRCYALAEHAYSKPYPWVK